MRGVVGLALKPLNGVLIMRRGISALPALGVGRSASVLHCHFLDGVGYGPWLTVSQTFEGLIIDFALLVLETFGSPGDATLPRVCLPRLVEAFLNVIEIGGGWSKQMSSSLKNE